jgi:spore coat protein U-like protein
MTRLTFWLSCCAMGGMLSALPAWAADTACGFRARGLSLNFGVLDPSINSMVSKPIVAATSFANLAGDCTGAAPMTISIQGGATSRQLTKGSDTIAYTISGFPISLAKPGNSPPGQPNTGWSTWLTGAITATVQWSAYANAPAGTYTDAVTIEVTP